MSVFDSRYDQIEAYIKGKLNEIERIAFEEELKYDATLKEEVDTQKASYAIIEQVYLQEMSKIIRQQSLPKSNLKWKWISGILVLATSLSLCYIYSSNVESSVSEEVVKHKEVVIVKEIIVEPESGNSERIKIKKEGINNSKKKEVVLITKEFSPENDIEVEGNTSVFVTQDSLMSEESPPVLLSNQVAEESPQATTEECVQPKLRSINVVDCHLEEVDGQLQLDESLGLFYSINNTEFTDYPETKGLPSGQYIIQVSDGKGCVFDLGEYTIKQLACLAKRDIAFNTSYESVLEVPIKEQDRTEITILNKLGKTVLTSNLYNNTVFEWDGKYDNGDAASLGIHKLVIENESKETCLYNVVIEK